LHYCCLRDVVAVVAVAVDDDDDMMMIDVLSMDVLKERGGRRKRDKKREWEARTKKQLLPFLSLFKEPPSLSRDSTAISHTQPHTHNVNIDRPPLTSFPKRPHRKRLDVFFLTLTFEKKTIAFPP
jgi:hypothetical protein